MPAKPAPVIHTRELSLDVLIGLIVVWARVRGAPPSEVRALYVAMAATLAASHPVIHQSNQKVKNNIIIFIIL